MKVIISEAARKHNREALLGVILKEEDGYYSLPYKLVGTEFYDIKTALLYSVQLNKLQNVKIICEFLKRHENMQGLDLDCVIRAIKHRNYEAAKLIVSVYQEKLKDKKMMENEHFICEYSPYHHPRPDTLDVDTVIFAIKNWDEELTQFVASIYSSNNNTIKCDEKHLNRKLKTFFFQEKYEEREPIPITASVLRLETKESVEERSTRYTR